MKFPILLRDLERDARYLRPEAIYALNRVLYEFLDTLKITPPELTPIITAQDSRAWVVPTLFDQCTRTWHFACVLREVWKDRTGQTDEVLQDVLWLLTKIAFRNDLKLQFAESKGNFLVGEYSDAYEKVSVAVEKLCKDHINECLMRFPFLSEEWDTPSKEQEAFKNFKNGCAQYVTAALCQDNNLSDAQANALVQNVLLVYHGLQVHRSLFLPGLLYRGLGRLEDKGSIIDRFEGQQDLMDISKVFGRFIAFGDNDNEAINIEGESYNQFSVDLEDKEKCTESDWKKYRIDLGLDLALPFYLRTTLQQQEKHKANAFLVLPIHDVWLGNVGYGGLMGCLLCTFKNDEDRKAFIENTLPKLRPVCEVLAAELTMSALATVSSLSINPPYDLVEHFIRVIIHVQDWECVTVYRKNNNGRKRLYWYRRITENNDAEFMFNFNWRRCTPPKQDDQGAVLEQKFAGHDGRRILSWEGQGRDIWTRALMPELSAEEEEKYRDIVLEFEYPRTATVPPNRNTNDETHKLFELVVIQRQIEVLRALIPKVRARRSALRNATAAIMGRNMSHNIGSHVLARHAMKLASRAGVSSASDSETAELLRYLQRRMDFIAEITTSSQAYWSQALSLKARLKSWSGDATENGGGSPILEHITGKDSLKAEITFVDKDFSFDCPGGEIGAHALYVILENIIRNSARHNRLRAKDDGLIKLCVGVQPSDRYKDFLEVSVIDLRSTELAKEIEGSDKVKRPVVDHLNWILGNGSNKEGQRLPLLKDSGEVEPHYWGIREMQICAAYLRKISLDNLESRIPAPNVLEADKTKGGALVFRFFVQRARLCMVLKSTPIMSPKDAALLYRHGIKMCCVEDRALDAHLKDGYSYVAIAPNLDKEHTDITKSLAACRHEWPIRTLESKHWETVESALQNLKTDLSKGGNPDAIQAFLRELDQLLLNDLVERHEASLFAACPRLKSLQAGFLWAENKTKRSSRVESCMFTQIVPKERASVTDEGAEGRPGHWLNTTKDVRHKCYPPSLIWIDHMCEADLFHHQGGLSLWKKTANLQFVEGVHHFYPQCDALKVESGLFDAELMAAAVSTVVILDERVQTSLRGLNSDGLTFAQQYRCQRIFVPAKNNDTDKSESQKEKVGTPIRGDDPNVLPPIDLDSPELPSIENYLKALRERISIDFMVIHQTIIEGLVNDGTGTSYSQGMDNLVTKLLAAGAPTYLVITSGRGIPANVPTDARFAPISALLEYLTARPSKLGLMRILWQARVPRSKKRGHG